MKATHNVKAYRNSTDTAAQAPFFGTYISRENVPVAALCAQVAGYSGLTEIQARAAIEGSFDAIAELEKEGLVIVHLDGLSVCAVITGSFPTGDAAFDPERNALELAIRLDDSLRLALASATAQMVTDADLTKVRLDNVKDIEVDRPVNLIHGRHPFRGAGYNIVLSDAGARVYLKDRVGTEHAVVVDEVHSNQLFTAHTAELLEGGDYTLWVESRGGDAEGPLQRDKCRVKYLREVDPEPVPETVTITNVCCDDDESYVQYGSPILVFGTGLKMGEGDALYMKRSDLGDEGYHQLPAWAIGENDEGTQFILNNGDGEDEQLWEWIGENIAFDTEHSGMTLKLVSHGGVPSSAPQTVTANAQVLVP